MQNHGGQDMIMDFIIITAIVLSCWKGMILTEESEKDRSCIALVVMSLQLNLKQFLSLSFETLTLKSKGQLF